ncbi:hypothetical protein ppKF707_0724 [Metapseudomonas furukawaii]|nr:hypothetical protein ppKF707_0724 [Pseudomonas furukawaii]
MEAFDRVENPLFSGRCERRRILNKATSEIKPMFFFTDQGRHQLVTQ